MSDPYKIQPADSRLLLNTREAANLLGVSFKTFQKLYRNEGIAFVMVGKEKRFPRKHLEQWINRSARTWDELSAAERRAQVATSSRKGWGRRTGNSTSRSTVVDFETVCGLAKKA